MLPLTLTEKRYYTFPSRKGWNECGCNAKPSINNATKSITV